MIKILLFDDRVENRGQVKTALCQALGDKGSVQDFVSGAGGLLEGTYDERLKLDLEAEPNKSATLIIADSDLSITDNFRGLSEPTVRRVADQIGIPECGYARGDKADDAFLESGKLREASIRLSFKPSIERFAERAVAVAEGFSDIDNKLTEMKNAGRQSPGKLLAAILGKPDYADKISFYASGDQSRLASINQIAGNEDQRRQRVACLLGYWLWDSVLRFPGVTVGIIPASSYLNILENVFKNDPEIQSLFTPARYHGPFAKAKVEMWWRGMLDDIISDSGCSDGREFVSKKLGRDIPPSQCCDDSSIPAGYYCMLTERPVSLKNSKGGLPWFPRGGDLARVSTKKLEELGPWL
jgi:hypothetical protein